jgi:hypothetical protein
MTASYDVISETLLKIGPSLVAQFAAPSYCTLQNKADDESLFVALAWCEAIGRTIKRVSSHAVAGERPFPGRTARNDSSYVLCPNHYASSRTCVPWIEARRRRLDAPLS